MPDGRGRTGRWLLAVGRSGRDGGFGRLLAKRCRPTRPARRGGKVRSVTKADRRAVAAEAGDSLLEPAGAAGSPSGGGGFLPAAERTVRQKMPSCGAGCTLWAALDGQRVQAVEQPCRRPEDAAIAQCTGQSQLRRPGGAA